MAKHKIGGKSRGMTFGLLAVEYYCDALGRDVEALDDIFLAKSELDKLRSLSTLVWAAMTAYCELETQDVDFTLANVKQWMGNIDDKTLTGVVEDFKKSKYMGRTIESYYFAPIEGEQDEKKPESEQDSQK